jgi:hypothetical protein
MRVLAWDNRTLYASSGYDLYRADIAAQGDFTWRLVARHRPGWIKNLTCRSRLAYRLLRDGYHALATLPTGHLVATIPGAIIRLEPGEMAFRTSFRILRGTRPLHITATPDGTVYWGEYFDNRDRSEVHIYASTDQGLHWDVAHTFPKRAIRHVHNIVYDRWADRLWVLTGDYGSECRILSASKDFRTVDQLVSGNQQVRAAALLPRKAGAYFSSDTPLEQNHIYCLHRSGTLSRVTRLSGSSIYGCSVGAAMFFSTMVEPSSVNLDRHSLVFGSVDTNRWNLVLSWEKDSFPMRLFQYGNAILPDGENTTDLLAVSTVAVRDHDLETSIWRLEMSAEDNSRC